MLYDWCGRISTRYYVDGDLEETGKTMYRYDDFGRETEMLDYRMENGTETLFRVSARGYDGCGRTAWVSETDCSGTEPSASRMEEDRITYGYDTEDRIVSITYPMADGGIRKEGYVYDAYGRISEITGKRASGSAVTLRSYCYDGFGRVSRILEEYHYRYDRMGRILQKRETDNTPSAAQDRRDHTVSYTYDAFGQLVRSADTDHRNNDAVTETVYSYDMVGNRTGMTKGNEVTSYEYNGLHQLTSSVTREGSRIKEDVSYTYDENGNETGQRVEKNAGGSVTRYHYLDGSVSFTTGEDGSEKTLQYLAGESGSIFLAEDRSGSTAYYLYDKDVQNSTSALLDSSGNGVVSYRYGDFGETETAGNGADWNEVCYAGGIYDKESGQYYLNARYYDPSSGRFLTEDSYRGEIEHPDTLHLYVYCANDPVNYVDPSGHKYQYIGFGLGLCLSAKFNKKSCVGGGEIIFFENLLKRYNNKMAHVYVYGGANVELMGLFKKTINTPKSMFSIDSLKSMAKPSWSGFSVSVYGIYITADLKKFTKYRNYEGVFKNYSLSFKHVSGTFSVGDGCKAYSIGYASYSPLPNFSASITYYHFMDNITITAQRTMDSVKNRIKSIAKRAKK